MTHGSDTKILRRKMTSRGGDQYKVEIKSSEITVRPFGSRSEKVLVRLDIGALYLRQLVAKLDAEKRDRQRAKRGGRSKR